MRLKRSAVIALVVLGLTAATAAPAYADSTPEEVAEQATADDRTRWETSEEVEAPPGLEPGTVCVGYYLHEWDSFWWFGNNNWHHHFRPTVCRNGQRISYRDLSPHWQTCSGFYHCDGISHFVTGGCVGCSFIQARGVANFHWSWGGSERSFTRCWNLRVNGNGSWSHWLGCG